MSETENQGLNQSETTPEKTFTQEEVTHFIQERVKGKEAEIKALQEQIASTDDLRKGAEKANAKIDALERQVALQKISAEFHINPQLVQDLGITWQDEDDLKCKLHRLKAETPSHMDIISTLQTGQGKKSESLGDRFVEFLNDPGY